MSVGKALVKQLGELPGGAVASAEGETLVVASLPAYVRITFFDRDRFSVTLRDLAVGAELPEPGDMRAFLSAAAAEVARRLSFLEEPLAVWELDGGERVAQLRSSPPQREGQELLYWEVTLSAGPQASARAVRYRWAPGMAERELVAYPATFALLGRMADALAAALQLPES